KPFSASPAESRWSLLEPAPPIPRSLTHLRRVALGVGRRPQLERTTGPRPRQDPWAGGLNPDRPKHRQWSTEKDRRGDPPACSPSYYGDSCAKTSFASSR